VEDTIESPLDSDGEYQCFSVFLKSKGQFYRRVFGLYYEVRPDLTLIIYGRKAEEDVENRMTTTTYPVLAVFPRGGWTGVTVD